MTPRRSLTLVTAPSTEPVTLDELKAFARVDSDDEDALLDSFLIASRQCAENFTRRSFLAQSWKLTVDLACGDYHDLPDGIYDLPVTALYGSLPAVIRLPKGPIRSIAGVTTYDPSDASSTFAPSNYTADLAGSRLVLKRDAVWPADLRPIAACEIVYSAGYGTAASDVPKPIQQAILMHATRLYETRGECGCETPISAACMMLQPYRNMDAL